MNLGTTPQIIIVEDDRRLSLINSRALETEGYEVKAAATLENARFLIKEAAPDVILLDVKMPDGNGFDFCREIRERTAAHIIFLTSVTESEGELEGLVAGGDDYLRKPYGIELLRERVRKALQKERRAPQSITRGPLTLHVVAAQASLDERDLLLTQKEFAVLLLLAQNEGRILSAEHIYEKAWGLPMAGDRNAVQMSVSRLRGKIEPAGYTICAYRGKGYAFERV
ncbi:MAG: response regulator transcription factor [Clostridiales Family XIII bacterium]|jgi:DNA-binding response OmpR family regulator|nr:response regulator transcription factor [Clostridiales Family XIII bacterium]